MENTIPKTNQYFKKDIAYCLISSYQKLTNTPDSEKIIAVDDKLNFEKFNISFPTDFTGLNLSVINIV